MVGNMLLVASANIFPRSFADFFGDFLFMMSHKETLYLGCCFVIICTLLSLEKVTKKYFFLSL